MCTQKCQAEFGEITWKDMAAILLFKSCVESTSNTPRVLNRIRMLRAPMDYGMGGNQPAIYGTVTPAIAITCYTEWCPAVM